VLRRRPRHRHHHRKNLKEPEDISDLTDYPRIARIQTDLVVQSNPDVIAQTSAKGGFAFARSGNVTAVSGPDGAKIIQNGPTTGTEVTPVPSPTTPGTEGGNNNVGFES